MQAKQYGILVILIIVSGFIGGSLTTVLLEDSPLWAEDQPPAVIRAQQFEIVNEQGQVYGKFGVFRQSPFLVLRGADQQPRVFLGMLHPGVPALAFMDEDGRTVWQAP